MKPSYTAYTVRDYQRDDDQRAAEWCKIGVAFLHDDAHGFDVVLDALPVNGRIVLRTNDPRIKELKKSMKR